MTDAMTQSLATIRAIRAEPRTILPTVRPILVTDRGAMRAYRDADIDTLLAIALAVSHVAAADETWNSRTIALECREELAPFRAALAEPPTP